MITIIKWASAHPVLSNGCTFVFTCGLFCARDWERPFLPWLVVGLVWLFVVWRVLRYWSCVSNLVRLRARLNDWGEIEDFQFARLAESELVEYNDFLGELAALGLRPSLDTGRCYARDGQPCEYWESPVHFTPGGAILDGPENVLKRTVIVERAEELACVSHAATNHQSPAA